MTRSPVVRVATVLAIATALAACDEEHLPTGASGSTASTTHAEDPPNPLLGEWARINSCDAFVLAFERARLDRLVPEWLVSAGYFDRTDQVDPTAPCQGAVEDRNSYFFQPSDRFGSLDQDEVLVDDGTYESVDESSIAIVGKVSGRRFRVGFRIANGRIRFHVPLPAACVGECRDDLAWVLSMFYPGELTRVT
jgi:hypothetical protein